MEGTISHLKAESSCGDKTISTNYCHLVKFKQSFFLLVQCPKTPKRFAYRYLKMLYF
jgi:hypothetical protein